MGVGGRILEFEYRKQGYFCPVLYSCFYISKRFFRPVLNSPRHSRVIVLKITMSHYNSTNLRFGHNEDERDQNKTGPNISLYTVYISFYIMMLQCILI